MVLLTPPTDASRGGSTDINDGSNGTHIDGDTDTILRQVHALKPAANSRGTNAMSPLGWALKRMQKKKAGGPVGAMWGPCGSPNARQAVVAPQKPTRIFLHSKAS